MKKILALLAMLCCFAATTAVAVPITGSINFAGNNAYLGGTTPATATGIDFLLGLTLFGNQGDYAAVTPGTTVTFQDFYFSPTMSPNPVAPLWTFDFDSKTYSFDMTSVSSSVSPDGSSLTLVGNGILSITGFDDTLGSWVFTTQGTIKTLSFSATGSSSVVPEPGTMLLLGAGLLGVGLYRRSKKA